MIMANMQDDISDVELKQRWRLYWIHSIFEFSNLALQRASWVQKDDFSWTEGEEWFSSFDECNSAYFDTLALYDGYKNALASGNVSQEEALHAKAFSELALSYIEPSEDPQEVLADKEWIEVVDLAQELWNYLKKTVTSQREIKLMQELEQKYPNS